MLTDGQKALLTEIELNVYTLRSEGLSWNQVAEKRNANVSTCRNQYHTARKKLARVSEDPTILKEKPVDVSVLADHCDQKAKLILESMTPDAIKSATLAQKANAFSTLIEKGRLLRGEATSIITHDDRRQIKDLIPAIMSEAKRRGIIEGEFTVQD